MHKDARIRFQLLDTYRGIAAILVVLYHFTIVFKDQLGYSFFNGFFLFGQSGVDFFFILSAFVITYRYFHVKANKESVAIFVKKRFMRIYPLYWIVCGIVLLI